MEIIDVEFDLNLYQKEEFKKEDIDKAANKVFEALKKNEYVYGDLAKMHTTLFSCMYKLPVKMIGLNERQVGFLIDDIMKDSDINEPLVAGRVSSMKHNKSYTVIMEMDSDKYHIFDRDSVPKGNLEYAVK